MNVLDPNRISADHMYSRTSHHLFLVIYFYFSSYKSHHIHLDQRHMYFEYRHINLDAHYMNLNCSHMNLNNHYMVLDYSYIQLNYHHIQLNTLLSGLACHNGSTRDTRVLPWYIIQIMNVYECDGLSPNENIFTIARMKTFIICFI